MTHYLVMLRKGQAFTHDLQALPWQCIAARVHIAQVMEYQYGVPCWLVSVEDGAE